jgi:Fur family transcriptional regulator, ferric uptake regulator
MIINKKNLRKTEPRRVILEEIKSLTSHPTADEIYDLVRKRIPRVSLGTIYRNLEILSSEGLIQKLDIGGTQRRFDGCTNNHYHFRCMSCGQVVDLTTKPLKEIESTISKLSPCEIHGHRLELIGLCMSCNPNQPSKSSPEIFMDQRA